MGLDSEHVTLFHQNATSELNLIFSIRLEADVWMLVGLS
jgi:hypothetical protein